MPMIITRGAASAQGFGWSAKTGPVTGQQAYTGAGVYSWVAPAGVTRVSIVAVSTGGNPGAAIGYSPCCCQHWYGGYGNRGGYLAYKNNITVGPGQSYDVTIGSCGNYVTGFNPSTQIGVTISGTTGNPCASNSGGYGGNAGYGGGGGGGAGGYTGPGGQGGDGGYGTSAGNGQAGTGGGSGGGGGGAGDGLNTGNRKSTGGGSGGGTGLCGQGANGSGGSSACYGIGGGPAPSGGGGSGGGYGGGGGGANTCGYGYGQNQTGAVRIIWPGCARSFPSTRTGNE